MVYFFLQFILLIYSFKRKLFFNSIILNSLYYCKRRCLFFKKSFNLKFLNWRRVNFFVLRKNFFKKRFKNIKKNIKDSNFFFKKNFFSILLKTRQFFSKIFFSKKYKRQKELTKYYTKLYKYNLLKKTPYTVINLLQRSHFFFLVKILYIFYIRVI